MTQQIAIHGLGYVGLTAAVHFAKAGWTVTAYDPDKATIDKLVAGKPRAGDFLEYLDHDVASLVAEGRIIPTVGLTDTFKIPVHLLAVPSERDGEPDMSIVKKVVSRLMEMVEPGTIILIESTLTPGTVDDILRSRVEGGFGYGARAIAELRLYLAVCPRRDWFADPEKNLATLSRVVGGVTPACTERAVEVLSAVSSRILPTDYRTAEVTKALENAWLHTLVMLPTELAMSRPDLNIAEAVELASTHWRLPDLFLGAGCGGRCVPLGTKYLLAGIDVDAASILEATSRAERLIRGSAAGAIARRVRQGAVKGQPPRVLILGAAYRPGFRDLGLSPGLSIAQHLRGDFGCDVDIVDPCWSPDELEELTGFSWAREITEAVDADGHRGGARWSQIVAPRAEGYQVVVLATPHQEYLNWPRSQDWCQGQVVFDTQGAWAHHRNRLTLQGVEYVRLGTPGWK